MLSAAEAEGFEVLVTSVMNLKHQQNLASQSIAIVVLGTTSWPRIQAAPEIVAAAIATGSPGTYTEVAIP